MSGLNTDSRKLINEVYGARAGEAYIEWGRFDAKGFHRAGFGRAATASPPDDQAVFWSAGLLKAGAPRADANVEKVMVFIIDDVGSAPNSRFDPAELGMFMPEPTIVTESSPGNTQWQWGLTDGLDDAVCVALRRGLPWQSHATAASNLIRLPMGVNGKPGVTHKVRALRRGPVYTGAEFVAKCGGLKVPVQTRAQVKGDLRAPSDAAVEAILKLLPNDGKSPYCDSNPAWFDFGMALHGATGGERLDLWLDWCSSQYQGYDPTETWERMDPLIMGWDVLMMYANKWGTGAREDLAAALFDDGADMFEPAGGGAAPAGDDPVLALQLTVAARLEKLHGDRLRWNVDTGRWHKFDGSIWRESPFKIGYELARQWALRAVPSLGKQAQGAVAKSGFCDGVEALMRSALAATSSVFDTDDWLLGTPGGTVDLRTGALRKARAGDMISKSTSVAPTSVAGCPRWLEFIDWACSDPAVIDPVTKKPRVDQGMRRTLQQWAGYCLTGDVSEEKVLFFFGGGKNGKGTFIETVQSVMGDYFQLAEKDMFMETRQGVHTEAIAALAGARMVVADEVPVTARWNESFLKACSGGGMMSSRHLYGRKFTFPIRFKVTIIGNDKPEFQGKINEALKRRLHLAGFRMTANPVDGGLKAAVKAEGAGVLAWMLEGLADLLGSGALHIADSMIDATEGYFNENDLMGLWLVERTEKISGAETSAMDAFKDWTEWRNVEGNHDLFSHSRSFKAEMQTRGYVWKDGKKTSVIKGLALKQKVSTF